MQAIEKITYTNNWVTILFFVLLVGIFLLKLIDANELKKFAFTFFTFGLIEDEDIENKKFYNVSQIIIFLFATSVISLLLYKCKTDIVLESLGSFNTFFTVFFSLIIFFITKRFLEYVLILLFKIKQQVQFFMYLKNNYLYAICFLIYMALALSEYTSLRTMYVLFFATLLFLLRFVFLVIRNKKLIFNKLFYFILYICALEIAPLFVLFKLMF